MPVSGLDDICHCGRVAGDHTLREWSECLERTDNHVPYFATPDDAIKGLRMRFSIDDDTIIADNVILKAGFLGGSVGEPVEFKIPILIHEFAIHAHDHLHKVAKVLFMAGDAEGMRRYGKLARDTANGSANAASR